MATDAVYINEDEEQVCFDIEIRVPYSQARTFAQALTGNDDDVLLAAETAIRKRLGRQTGEEVELWLGPPGGREISDVMLAVAPTNVEEV